MNKEITINIPFTYTLDDEGFHSNKVLKTVKNMKDEVLAEIEAGVLSENEIFFEVKHERELEIYTQRILDMIEYMKDLGTTWKHEYFDFKSYTPEFTDDPEDERIFNIKLGELLMLKEILGL